MKRVSLTLELTEEEAQAWAQFLQRTTLRQFIDLAQGDMEQACLLREGAVRMQPSFAAAGYEPHAEEDEPAPPAPPRPPRHKPEEEKRPPKSRK